MKLDNIWEGMLANELQKLTEIRIEARFVMVHIIGGLKTDLSSEDFFSWAVIFAMRHNENGLPQEHGYPVSLVVPGLYF